jgi:hypothetical protein
VKVVVKDKKSALRIDPILKVHESRLVLDETGFFVIGPSAELRLYLRYG